MNTCCRLEMAQFFGLDKVAKLRTIIKDHGGLKAALYHLYWTDDLKTGTHVGTDEYGNKYYHNPAYFRGRDRWVIYNPKHGVDYDASMVPATWFGWLHYKTDKTPVEKAPVDYSWLPKHTPNPSGSSQGRDSLSGAVNPYMPYTTTKPKIEAWVPPKNN